MVTEKKYSVESVERLQQQAHSESRESVQEVSCFVRSEIKWVFLKSVKVQTITQRGELERWFCSLNPRDWTLSSVEQAFNLRVCLCFSAYTDTWLRCSAKYFSIFNKILIISVENSNFGSTSCWVLFCALIIKCIELDSQTKIHFYCLKGGIHYLTNTVCWPYLKQKWIFIH